MKLVMREFTNRDFTEKSVKETGVMKTRLLIKICRNAVCILILVWVASGCGPKASVIRMDEATESEIQEEDSDTEANVSEEENVSAEKGIPKADQVSVYVYVCGAVNNPGVYELPGDSRVFQAIELAGGFTEDAYQVGVNLADKVQDGQQLRILSQEEADGQESAGLYPELQSPEVNADMTGTKVNINQADCGELCELNGIGETKALAIIKYREENGPFATAQELKSVSGIGDKTYEKIKDDITVD